ncbi:type II toxin-antitoxin system RelE/ParE family toxin [Rhodoblastus sp.]|uniref:type II toxin-antitoxin system RelE/ParE family toxin n=1 Tax=Rhodoblastus sp. TaxID=1962975 RepID=UPI0026083E05|nr:type II toxin-antitoxin system RelE/ParE family toxin [Rhodoblastus sp.]
MQTVIETASYLARIAKLGLAETEREAIKAFLADNPDAGDLMQGTGGARKVRIAGRGHGKSGGYRVITFYAADDVPVFLLDIYGKGEKDNLSKAERNAVKAYLDGLADDYRKSARERAKTITKQVKE